MLIDQNSVFGGSKTVQGSTASASTMCYFAHFGLMINLIFLQNVPFFMQDIGVICQIFAKFHGFIVKYRFQNNFFQKNFLKKKAGNSNFLRLKIGDF